MLQLLRRVTAEPPDIEVWVEKENGKEGWKGCQRGGGGSIEGKGKGESLEGAEDESGRRK